MNSIARLFRRQSRSILGPLEQQVLDAVWRQESATVREVMKAGNVKQRYTTIMTTMDRLYKKGFLNRVPAQKRAFRYSARHTRQELERVTATEAIRQLLSASPGAELPLSYLVEAVSKHDARLLDELERAVEQKRSELRKRERD